MEYIISKEECEKNISGVCEGCGGELSAIETIDNSNRPTFWQGCTHCAMFRGGVDQKYFKIARKLIEEGRILPFTFMDRREYEDTPERLEYFFDCQTAGLSREIKYIEILLSENK